jgi:hypothetical protein
MAGPEEFVVVPESEHPATARMHNRPVNPRSSARLSCRLEIMSAPIGSMVTKDIPKYRAHSACDKHGVRHNVGYTHQTLKQSRWRVRTLTSSISSP